MLKIMICDDEKDICLSLKEILEKFVDTHIGDLHIEFSLSGEELIKDLQSGKSYDLIFLDIELWKLNGIEVASYIRNELHDYTTKIVFITSKQGYEKQLFDVLPLNFLEKPIEEKKLFNCVLLTKKLMDIELKTFEYKKGGVINKVSIGDILYFENNRKIIKIVMRDDEDFFYESLENVHKRLPSNFLGIHQSFVVNYDMVRRFSRNHLVMINGDELPISQRKQKSIRNLVLSFEKEKRNG